jgi:hypothetical protein
MASFKAWAQAFTGRTDLALLNVHSDMQKAQFLYGLPRSMLKEKEKEEPTSSMKKELK